MHDWAKIRITIEYRITRKEIEDGEYGSYVGCPTFEDAARADRNELLREWYGEVAASFEVLETGND